MDANSLVKRGRVSQGSAKRLLVNHTCERISSCRGAGDHLAHRNRQGTLEHQEEEVEVTFPFPKTVFHPWRNKDCEVMNKPGLYPRNRG